ncbi:MAG: DUF4976 domain-containing protein [Nitrosopumilaceae archaeon]|nr:DUF4976 domain-containing protein [Nitrosopumilaceae archaeon]
MLKKIVLENKLMMHERYNIILITLDGLRKDRIESCPTLKSLANSNVYFSNMITVSPYTLASLHSIFSGMYPSLHGVNAYYNMFKFKKNEITTLSQLLQKKGYYTCCDIISDVIIPSSGFDERNIFDEKTVNFNKRHTDLIRKLSDKKFFLFLHYTEPHKHLVDEVIQKYKNKDDAQYYKSQKENNTRYDSYLPALDKYVSDIIKTLDESKISDKTILIFHADHGTSVGEKIGEKFYGVFVYDYTINVFSIMKIPGYKHKKINSQCRTIDLYPTIAEFVGLTAADLDNKVQGKTLSGFIDGSDVDDREAFVETGGLYGPWPSPNKHNVFCVKINNKKLIYNDTPQTWEFYDLNTDPNELNNVFDNNSQEIIEMKKKLLSYLKENQISTKLDST